MVIPHSRPLISASDVEAAVAVLKSGRLAQGPKVREFEKKLAALIGRKAGAATSSGTAALHLSLLALGVKTGDEVILPSYVCPAVLNAVSAVGARPVLADIEPRTFNIDPQAVRKAVSRRTKAVVVPHLFGCPAEIDEITKLGPPVIEDCAQALGAEHRGLKAGRFGRLSVFSFFATKMIAAGEGGMVLADSKELMAKIKDGRDYDEKKSYVPRFNYKMTDLQAALGVSQLASLSQFIDKRRAIANLYFKQFENCDFAPPPRLEGRNHIYYRFVVQTRTSASPFLKKLAEKKVMGRRPVFKPLHRYLGQSGFPRTDEAWERSISLPLYPALSPEEIERIVSVVKDIF